VGAAALAAPPPLSLLDTHGVPRLDLVSFMARRGVPSDLADLFSRMLQWDPRTRLTAEEALRHPALALQPAYHVTLPQQQQQAHSGGAALLAAQRVGSSAAMPAKRVP